MLLSLIGPSDEKWDFCFIAEYPNTEAFVSMVKDPDYREAVKHRQISVQDSRLIRMAPLSNGRILVNKNKFSFSFIKADQKARLGLISTPRGEIRTPAFMPVGTAATVKAMLPESVSATGADILLGNTYHLMLRPTAERISKLGGLHEFMDWRKPILTDSGGFQVMSLAELRKLTEEGVTFKSHIDGSQHILSPERSMDIQKLLGSDIAMCFDECPALPSSHERISDSMRLSMRWAQRSRDAFGDRPGHALFGIQQGGLEQELRAESAEILRSIEFDGYALGGLAVGEGQEEMFRVLDFAPDMLPMDKPRYLMGLESRVI